MYLGINVKRMTHKYLSIYRTWIIYIFYHLYLTLYPLDVGLIINDKIIISFKNKFIFYPLISIKMQKKAYKILFLSCSSYLPFWDWAWPF